MRVGSGRTAAKPDTPHAGLMEQYLDAQKADEHRVAIQLMRHTLMHTGRVRQLKTP
jgi:hypothetical protein